MNRIKKIFNIVVILLMLLVFNSFALADTPQSNKSKEVSLQENTPKSICLYQQAKLFKSIDENDKPVDMQNLINGRPLVLIVSSAT